MEFADFIKIYGPLAIGWVIAAYLGKFILDRYQADIKARVKLAEALSTMAKAVTENGRSNGE